MLPASYTVEAALVMPVVLASIALLITAGFRLHDLVLANFVADEVVELYGHLPEDGDTEAVEAYGNSRLSAVLSDTRYLVTVEEYLDGARAELTFAEGSREYQDAGSRPEKLMRSLTLLDAVLDE